MECRCYRGGDGRTRLKQLSMSAKDWAALVIVLAGFAGVILLNIFGPEVARL